MGKRKGGTINPDWPPEIQAAFLANPESTMATQTTGFGTTTYTTDKYERPANGEEHLHPAYPSGVE
jgi:hypothetical protein